MAFSPKATVSFQVDAEVSARLKTYAGTQGVSASDILRNAVSVILDGQELPARSVVTSGKSRREGKVTVRLSRQVKDALTKEAEGQGAAASTWAMHLLKARYLGSPQPTKDGRKMVHRGFKQLRGMATNLNQIATVMNRGVFTGDNYAPSRQEISELRREVNFLRAELTAYARGQLEFQTDRGEPSE